MTFLEAMSVLNVGHPVRRRSWFSDEAHFCLSADAVVMNPLRKEAATFAREDVEASDWELYFGPEGIDDASPQAQ